MVTRVKTGSNVVNDPQPYRPLSGGVWGQDTYLDTMTKAVPEVLIMSTLTYRVGSPYHSSPTFVVGDRS